MSAFVYPDRQKRFAQRFIRWLFISNMSREIGARATLLLASVVTAEEHYGFRGPVCVFDGQLAEMCDCSRATMRLAREKAVSEGLLRYLPGEKGRPSKYFVTQLPNVPLGDDSDLIFQHNDQ